MKKVKNPNYYDMSTFPKSLQEMIDEIRVVQKALQPTSWGYKTIENVLKEIEDLMRKNNNSFIDKLGALHLRIIDPNTTICGFKYYDYLNNLEKPKTLTF